MSYSANSGADPAPLDDAIQVLLESESIPEDQMSAAKALCDLAKKAVADKDIFGTKPKRVHLSVSGHKPTDELPSPGSFVLAIQVEES